MSDENEKINPLMGLYSIGVIGCTAVMYPQDGFWLSLAESLIWPIYAGIWIADKIK